MLRRSFRNTLYYIDFCCVKGGIREDNYAMHPVSRQSDTVAAISTLYN